MSAASTQPVLGPLRGRVRELALLAGMVEEARSGIGRAALVVGEAGVGKTRILTETVAAARAADMTIARVGADEVDSMAPLSTLVRALSEAEPVPLSPTGVTALRTQASLGLSVIREVQSLLERASTARPVLIAIDDIDAADELTLHAVRILTQQLTSSPVTWALTARPANAGPIGNVRSAIMRAGGLMVTLDPAADDVVVQIIADVLGAPPAPSLVEFARGTGGNLFLLLEMLHGARAEGIINVVEGGAVLAGEAVPRRLEEALRGRLAGLTPDARHLLDVAAVVGRSFRLDDVLALVGRSTAGALPSVHELLNVGVVVPSGAGFAFRHGLLRRAVLHDLPPPLRHLLHRDVARQLLHAGAPAIDVAGHLIAGAAPGDPRAVDLLAKTADRLLDTAPRQAAELYQKALALAAGDVAAWLAIVPSAGRALLRANRLAETRELLDSAIAAGLGLESEAGLWTDLSEACWLRGRYAEAIDVLRPMAQRTELSASARARIDLSMARTLAIAGRPLQALDMMEEAERVVRQSGDTGSVGFALATRSYALRFAGRFTESLEVAAEAVRQRPDRVAGILPEPAVWLARSLAALDRLDDAERVCVDLMRDVRVAADPGTLPAAHATYARLLLARGRVADAVTEAEAGLAALEVAGGNPLAADLFACAAIALWTAGDDPAALRTLERGEELLHDGGFGVGHLPLARALLAGPDDAVAAMVGAAPLVDAMEESFGQLVFDPTHGPALVRVAAAAGDNRRAEQVTRAVQQLAATNAGVVSWVAAAEHASGLLDRDVVRIRSAADGYSASGRPLAAAVALADVAHLLAGLDDPATAAARDEAVAVFSELGADGPAGRLAAVRAAVRTTGADGRPARKPRAGRPRFGWDSLTEAELRVVALAATGATNKEIAAQLWLSPYTVDTHMRHSLTKLGLRSRVALARLAGERGVPPPTGSR
jgi:DNA-binding CsgD family transcriptional regulator/tetratricopeptide (TPR) repeat protein